MSQSLTTEQLETLKGKLSDEQAILEEELSKIGRINPSNPFDWEPKPPEFDIQHADKNEEADKKEGYEENTAILKDLEIRVNNVKAALERIEKGTYGVCEVGNEPIKLERLNANPAARTCIKHMTLKE